MKVLQRDDKPKQPLPHRTGQLNYVQVDFWARVSVPIAENGIRPRGEA
jgi:hypothetical protein